MGEGAPLDAAPRGSTPDLQPTTTGDDLANEMTGTSQDHVVTETAETSTEDVDTERRSEAPPLSKNQQKKLAKKRQREETRTEFKAKRKEKRKADKLRKRAAEATRKAEQPQEKPKPPPAQLRSVKVPVTIILDCQFEDLMTENELISLAAQVTRCYSVNRKARFKCQLAVSSFGGKFKERFDTVLGKVHENWNDIGFSEDDFVDVAERAKVAMDSKLGGRIAGVLAKASSAAAGHADGEAHTNGVPMPAHGDLDAATDDVQIAVDAGGAGGSDSGQQQKPKANSDTLQGQEPTHGLETENEAGSIEQNLSAAQEAEVTAHHEAMINSGTQKTNKSHHEGEVVYLTSDSPNTLYELKPYSSYIIGGIVDKNRHKGICYKRARDRNIKTAKLPIGDYLKMQSRKVLTTNHVNEIMLEWLETGDWGEAMIRVMPKRKGGELKRDDEDVECGD